MKRGFKSECESIAAAVRSEIGLDTRARLHPRLLAEHLGIPIHPVSSLQGDDVAAAIRHVTVVDPAVLSAMTIFPAWPRRHRIIIFNDGNSEARQNSDVAHELSHGLLLHEPRTAIVNGCRDYAKAEEDEAAWLSGCLLVPRDAALVVASDGLDLRIAAAQYGVSADMMRYRVHSTGAKKQAEASRARRTRSA